MQLPRFLWVPFELGRPFGAPNEPDFQRRVLRAALELLQREDGPVILEDFPDEAPTSPQSEAWACPVSFSSPSDEEPGLARETLAEIDRLAPWHEVYVAERGHSAPSASGLIHADLVAGLGRLADGTEDFEMPTELSLQEWVRLGCDDLRTWYMEAAQGQPGRAQPNELQDWFWCQTAFARLIAAAALHFVGSEDAGRQMFGRRALVPRVYMGRLMSGVDLFI
jgi:hypothetical protein